MAAERLGVPFAKVSVERGDTNYPPAPVAGGSNTTASSCSAVMKACDAIRAMRGRWGESDSEAQAYIAAFRDGLHMLGWTELPSCGACRVRPHLRVIRRPRYLYT
jgi:CO/xanthine dehydrogenase Mo-binding subunit